MAKTLHTGQESWTNISKKAPRWPQDGPQAAPRWPMMAPRRPKIAKDQPKIAEDGQDSARRAGELEKWLQEGFRERKMTSQTARDALR